MLGIVAWPIGSILALVFGYMAKRQIDESGGVQGGRGLAIAGIVLGWVGIAGLIILIVVLVLIGVSGGFDDPTYYEEAARPTTRWA